MPNIKEPLKWHQMDEIAASDLTKMTKSPGNIFTLPIDSAPSNLQQMPGAVSYFVSDYIMPQVVMNGLSIGGEIVIARTEGETLKAYNFVFATSSDGYVYFNGPHKDFENHHINKNSPIPIESLFGHTPFSDDQN
jgi:hypothetical protein